MEIKRNEIIPLGYGKYYRSDKIIGMEPIEQDRGPARRTFVYIEGRSEPVVAARSEAALLKDLVISPREVENSILMDFIERLLHEVEKVGPIMRRSIREETGLDLDGIMEKARRILSKEEESFEGQQPLFS